MEGGNEVLSYIPLTLEIICIPTHILGIYLLFQSKSNNPNSTIILINLSVAESFMAAIDFAYNVMLRNNVSKNVTDYVYTTSCTCFVIPSFLILTVLALDRFFEVYYNIRYPIYFQKRKIVGFLAICWLLGFLQFLVLTFLRFRYNVDTLSIVFKFLLPGFEIVFCVTAAPIYGYIYKKYRQALKMVSAHQNNTFTRHKFFVPTLILLNFCFFVIIPDQLHLFLFYIYKTGSPNMMNIILMLYAIGFICDALIYTFLQPITRKILFRKLRQWSTFIPMTSLN